MHIPDSIKTCPAILAAIIHAPDTPHLTLHGEGSWHPMLQGSLLLMSYTTARFIRVVDGDHTIVIQREGEVLIGVVFVTGDAIAKSLHRMLRRAAKPGGRVRKPKPADASPAPVIGGGL